VGLVLMLAMPARGANFTCPDTTLVRSAEQARIRSAVFWSGQALPADWSFPCPIAVNHSGPSGSGKTRFRIERGEVFSWQMEVAGTPDELLRNVIPHEVDHMVRVSLTRRTMERWLDEGCASLMESAETHAGLRQMAGRINPDRLTLRWLESTEYPSQPDDIDELYALGFSLVEFLLTRGSPARLLEFQRDAATMDIRLQRHYRLSVTDLRESWSQWRTNRLDDSCITGDCPIHHPVGANPEKNSNGQRPVLIVWTASWCGPCQQFKNDYGADAEFRNTLNAAFELQFRDVDVLAKEAAAVPVKTVPMWILPDQQWSGYAGSEQLLSRLGLKKSDPGSLGMTPGSAGALPADSQPSKPVSGRSQPEHPPSPPPSASPSGQIATGGTGWRILQWVPVTLTALQWMGIIGGSVATGGIGGMALTAAMFLVRWRSARGQVSSSQPPSTADPAVEGGEATGTTAPFPRQLDEAGELLALRQSEGRVATLDTLRGMFLDDELEKLMEGDPVAAQLALSLRKAIDARVEEVAPLTTTVG